MKALYKKELSFYFNSPVGYIVLVLFGVFANFLFVKDIFVINSASLRPFFSIIPWLFIVFIPALGMRLLSEEKRTNTLEVLLTLPVSETQVVVSKFFAALTVLFVALILTVGLPMSLVYYVPSIYIPEILSGYAGVLLLGAGFLAVTMFYSSLTSNQVVAFLASVVTLFLLLVVSTDFSASVLPKVAQDFLIPFGPFFHLQNFIKGVIDLRSVVYFATLTGTFLFLTIINLEKRG